MANIKSAKKQARQNVKRRAVNLTRKTAIKSAVRRLVDALDKNDVALSKTLFVEVQKKIARAKNKKNVHAKTASRKIGRLAKRLAHAARTGAQPNA